MGAGQETTGTVRVRPQYRVLAEEEKTAMEDFKNNVATFIDACEELKGVDGEKTRLACIAQSKAEEAVMFAVKAVTK